MKNHKHKFQKAKRLTKSSENSRVVDMKNEFEPERYIVKIKRAFRTSVLFVGTMEEAKVYARNLNTQYQTDEYKVEKFDMKESDY